MSPTIHWCLRRFEDHRTLELGEPTPWLLSPGERPVFASLRVPKRRREWLLGRQAAKDLCRAWLAARGQIVASASISILPRMDGSPQALLDGEGPLPLTLSLSHRGDTAVCALVDGERAPLGIDLELPEARPAGFPEDFFTRNENEALPDERGDALWHQIAEVWSLKESALKALRVGLTASTHAVEVGPRELGPDGWASAPLSLSLPGAPARGKGLARWEGAAVVTLAWLGEGQPAVWRADGPKDAQRAGDAAAVWHPASVPQSPEVGR